MTLRRRQYVYRTVPDMCQTDVNIIQTNTETDNADIRSTAPAGECEVI